MDLSLTMELTRGWDGINMCMVIFCLLPLPYSSGGFVLFVVLVFSLPPPPSFLPSP